MALTLYRRHRPECEAGRPHDARSSELEEHRKSWGRRCTCQIHMSGTLGGTFSRKAAGTSEWSDAHRIAEAYGRANAWIASSRPIVAPSPAPVPVSEPQPTHARMPIADALALFRANRKAAVAHSTYRKYRTFTKQFQIFAESRGYVMLDQFRPADIDVFYISSPLGPRSKAKLLDRVRMFFRFAVHREWITKSPVSPDLKPPAGATKAANKMPFTDEQLADIIKACDQVEDRRWGNRYGSGVWTGEDLKDLIWTMVYTGLRISDVVLFDLERLQGNEVFLRAKKNGGDVFAYLPDWLRDRLLARARRHGKRLFFVGEAAHLDTTIECWRNQLGRVFALADVGDDPATPHRFRHTFARMLLQKGVSVADVADLLGDDEETVRQHYARWLKRSARR